MLNQQEKIKVTNLKSINLMDNLFIIENLKKVTRILPILKIQIYQKEISLIINRDHLLIVLFF
jgi:hypothetical protein